MPSYPNKPILALAAAAVLAGAGVASAQSRPSSQASSPFWNGNAPAGTSAEAERDETGNGFPTDLVTRVAPARADLALAQAEHVRTQTAYTERLDALQTQYTESSEYRDARQAVADARVAVEEAQLAVLEPLEDDEEYVAARSLQSSLASQVREEHARADTDYGFVHRLSEEALQYARLQSDRESELLANDPAYQDAIASLRGAVETFRELERQHEETMRTDAELLELRRAATNARTALAAAEAYADATEAAASVAVDYARERNRLEYGGGYSYSPYGYGGYGSRYGYGGYNPYGYYGRGYGGYGGSGFIYGGGVTVTPFERVIPTLTNSVTNQTPGAPLPQGSAPDPEVAAGRQRAR